MLIKLFEEMLLIKNNGKNIMKRSKFLLSSSSLVLSLTIPKISLARVSKNYFKLTAQLSKFKFEQKGIKKDQLILNYCGGKIAASLNGFALLQLGFENLQIYDNSMS